jgi:hypothetical protein
MAALDAMSAHHCDNAFFDVKFGCNPFGITLATPSNMMHLFESGIVKHVCQTFVHEFPWWCNTSHNAQLPPLAGHDVCIPLVGAYSPG